MRLFKKPTTPADSAPSTSSPERKENPTPSPEQMQEAMRSISDMGWEAPMPVHDLVEPLLWVGELQRQIDELQRRFNALQDYVMSEEGN